LAPADAVPSGTAKQAMAAGATLITREETSPDNADPLAPR
jgi:hypothetical protein